MKRALKRLADRFREPAPAPAAADPAQHRAPILDQYVRKAPDPQSALDLFKGNWWSSFPGQWSGLQAGQLPLFDDPRIKWAIEALGGVNEKTILELGPLEGAHTYLLERAAAKSIVAIEASSLAYLKCLVVKEVLGLRRARFLLGDFEDYLRASPERFDAVIACGVLYHLKDPVELIHNLARVTDHVFIWTQYFIRERVAGIPHMANRFPGSHAAEFAGFRYTAHRYEYGDFLDTTRFAGGSDEFSHWLGRDDLMGALRHAGFTEIRVGEDDLEHANGPCISLLASRAGG
jgi:hypothetical protein